jgi:arylesterase/paraoxonase
VTNDHGSTTAFGKTLEDYLRLPRGNVVYFDGTQFSVAAKRIRYANGIGMSGNGAAVYVASTTGFRIRVYRRNWNTGELDFDHDVKLRTGVDNIEVDSRGSLLVGCHPKLLTFSKHGADPTRLSPSQILKLTLRSQQEASVEEVFLDAGERISGSSVAAVYGEIMLIGAVFGNHFLLCRF